ncbi:MAG: phosphoribosylglycinamide formyltransferase [Acidimicrobiales bacterium]
MTAGSPARLAVLVSGNGSNLQAVLDACATGMLDADVVLVLANQPDAYALTRAAAAGVPTEVRPHQGRDRRAYDAELADLVDAHGADLVVLAGWNRLLTSEFVARHTTINLHPAKPGTFVGLGAIETAYEAWRAGRIDEGGVMVHFVPDEGVDDGPTIGWAAVPFEPGDTLETYEARVHAAEHTLLVESIATVLARAEATGGR